jgi:hypothetical protein
MRAATEAYSYPLTHDAFLLGISRWIGVSVVLQLRLLLLA